MADRHPAGHESPGVPTRTILKVAAALFGTMIVVLVILYFSAMNSLLGHHAEVVRRAGPVPPPPRLQPHPDVDIATLRKEKREKLSGYAWIGPAHRFAHIPIQRAMQLYVKRHAHDGPATGGKSKSKDKSKSRGKESQS